MVRNALLAVIILISASVTAMQLHFVTEEFPFFSYSRGATAGGALQEIVEATRVILRWHCIIDVLLWRRALQQAEEGEVDSIFTAIQPPARQQKFFITPMLVSSGYDFYAQRSSNFSYTQPSDLSGRQVGVYDPSGTSFVLKKSVKKHPKRRD